MYFFTVIWLGAVIYCFSKKDIRYMFTLTLLFMTFQCANVFRVGSMTIGPQVLTSFAFIIKSILLETKSIVIRKKYYPLYFLMLFLMVSILISEFTNKVFNDVLGMTIQLFIYILCFFAMLGYKKRMSDDDIYKAVRGVLVFVAIMGIVQLFTTMEILPLRKMLSMLFYNDNSYSVYFHHTNYKRMMSVFMEPSYFAGMAVGGVYYLLSIKEKWRTNYILIGILFIEILLSRSSTAYGCFLIMGVLFILLQKNISIKSKIVIFLIAVIGFLIIYRYFYGILDSVIFSKQDTGSYLTRTKLNNKAIREIKNNPYWGIGYKKIRASSLVYALSAQIGIIGFSIYMLINLYLAKPLFDFLKRKYHSIYQDASIYAIISVVTCQLISSGDLDLCVYWFWLYVYAMHIKTSIYND